MLLILGLVSFVGWSISMLSGGGGALILIPLVNLLLGAQAVAPVVSIGILVSNTQRTLVFWRQIDWSVVGWYSAGAIGGGVLGAYTFTQINLAWLQIMIGLALLLMGANYWLGSQERIFNIQTWQFLPMGFLNAFGSGLIGSTGPIMNPAYLNYGLVKEEMIATKAVSGAFVHIIKIVAYAALGALSSAYLIYGLLIGCVAIPANWLGQLALDKMSNDQFQQVVWTFVGLSGLLMLWGQRQLLSLG
ncbi:MAG: sulfite exporter TauE/SafE family protein [Pseudanabaenales cyanobacterium]|nr:sulfite exporter TauE/SafE family protein [Pseudanabaenales cyanobacterium]